ncbi:hypothetical protein [Musicola paradisiaca]|uniref:Uncharacterized protein n=1 Tax=Musicola paradisiaca (strain Ech703) TaxID=579405 RepID=C6C831_MUSP7|nr:hypothetical protein [Musicola paradisiaca]ACS84176.1 hypothetical protein Dd703_0362 [Musicola paradisiaca Ech703]
MAQLDQFLGTVLTDLTQARVTSDICSRDTSRFYQQDPVLRSYSVPRVALDSFEFELQFAITGVKVRKNDYDDKLKLERMYACGGLQLAEKMCQHSDQYLTNRDGIDTMQPAVRTLLMRLRNSSERSKLSQSLIQLLNEAQLVDEEGHFQSDKAAPLLVDRFVQIATQDLELSESLRLVMPELRNELKQVTDRELDELENSVRFLMECSEDFNLEVEVCADRLRERPVNTLSTLKLKGGFKNYVWTQSHQQDGTLVQKLVHE